MPTTLRARIGQSQEPDLLQLQKLTMALGKSIKKITAHQDLVSFYFSL